MENKRLVRSNDKMLFGVAGGLADYLNLDPVLVRLFFVLFALSTGYGLLVYIVMALVMPESAVQSAKAHGFDPEEIIIKDAA